jgi:hypothetical protein
VTVPLIEPPVACGLATPFDANANGKQKPTATRADFFKAVFFKARMHTCFGPDGEISPLTYRW